MSGRGWLHRVFEANRKAVEKWPDWKKREVEAEVARYAPERMPMNLMVDETTRRLRYTYSDINQLYLENNEFEAFLKERLESVFEMMATKDFREATRDLADVRNGILKAWEYMEKMREKEKAEEKAKNPTRWDLLP